MPVCARLLTPGAEQRADEVAVGSQVAQQLDGAGRGLELVDVAVELGQVGGGDPAHEVADLRQDAVLDLVDEIGDVAVVRVEGTTREAGTLGEGRHTDARDVLAVCKLARQRLAQGPLRTQRSTVAFLKLGLGHEASLLLSLCAIAQPEYYCTPCVRSRKPDNAGRTTVPDAPVDCSRKLRDIFGGKTVLQLPVSVLRETKTHFSPENRLSVSRYVLRGN